MKQNVKIKTIVNEIDDSPVYIKYFNIIIEFRYLLFASFWTFFSLYLFYCFFRYTYLVPLQKEFVDAVFLPLYIYLGIAVVIFNFLLVLYSSYKYFYFFWMRRKVQKELIEIEHRFRNEDQYLLAELLLRRDGNLIGAYDDYLEEK